VVKNFSKSRKSTAIPEGLMTKAIPTEQTTTDVIDIGEKATDEIEVNQLDHQLGHQLEVELIEQAKEIEERLQKDISDFKQLEERRKIETVEIHVGSNAKAITRIGVITIFSTNKKQFYSEKNIFLENVRQKYDKYQELFRRIYVFGANSLSKKIFWPKTKMGKKYFLNEKEKKIKTGKSAENN